MTHLVFPSEEFPAQPSVTLQVPDDWEPVHAPGSVVAARRSTDDDGSFVPNVVVRLERRPVGFEINDALDELRAFTAGRGEGTISEPFKADLGGQEFIGCDLSWVDDQVGTVLQAHLLGAVPSGAFVQLIQVTGSVGGARVLADYPTISRIMRSLTVAAS